MKEFFSPAAERNKEPILGVLKEVLTSEDSAVFEVGSGTGQHAIFFAGHFPWIRWTCSERQEYLEGLKAALEKSGIKNLAGPQLFEVGKDSFPKERYDLVFTANTFHIMSWKEVKTLVKILGKDLAPGARFAVYGPFKYSDRPQEESNKAFDANLRARDPASGIRSFEDVKSQFEKRDFRLLKDYAMPANNRMLVFIKI